MKSLLNKQRWRAIKALVPKDMQTPEGLVYMQWLECYYEQFSGHENVNTQDLRWLIQQRLPPDTSTEARELTLRFVDRLETEYVDEESMKGALNVVYDDDFAGRAGRLLMEYQQGGNVDVVTKVEELARLAKRAKSNGKADEFNRKTISEILAEKANDSGLKFDPVMFPTLHNCVGGLRGGKLVGVAARPDKGKTSLVAALLAMWVPQAVKYFGPERPVLWLNNEGTSDEIKARMYQAALRIDLTEMVRRDRAGTLEADYMAALNVQSIDHIRIKDAHGSSLAHAEQMIEDMNPCIVVFDMVANFRMDVGDGNKADAVERAWQNIRELAVMYNSLNIGTVQVSQDGDGQLYPQYSFLKDSRVGIQGALDLQLMMGAENSADMQNIRGLATPKNKQSVAGNPSHARAIYYFDYHRCVFQEQSSDTPTVSHEGPKVAGPKAQDAVPGSGGSQDGRDTPAPVVAVAGVPAAAAVVQQQAPVQLGPVPAVVAEVAGVLGS
ncbi:putative DNA helicase [Achromobacter phage vB_AxyP_19-32_Axy09]|uniref:Putative DNA helicase n=1 Tax=Achromobacter phage vB_AxyP_19-32_Axy09 TaxID=2591040 RepID=A0A514CTR8_9CAUD|nr:putative DNA helicase [Achromobacter phage vB_AxyP_19-32_Axy09]